MVQEGLRNTAAGASPIELRRGMEKAVAQIVDDLKRKSKSVSGEAIKQVATVSAGGDEEIGSMIADAIDKVSFDGVITVEESKSLATELDITEGMAFDRGYSSPYFVTDEDRLICEFENPSIEGDSKYFPIFLNLEYLLFFNSSGDKANNSDKCFSRAFFKVSPA